MKQLKCLLFVTLLITISLNSKGGTIFFPERTYPFNPQNDTVKHFVGELFGGGVIFYVDKTNKHGLICSMSDIRDPESSSLFKQQDLKLLKGRSDSTVLMYQVFAVDNPDRAITLCNSYTNSNYGTGQFSNWYLPTSEELKIMYNAKDDVNKTLEKCEKSIVDPLIKIYWSSSNIHNDLINNNWLLDFESGSLVSTNRPVQGRYFVRAIRAY